ncbi:hypothetical protein FLJC2902T_12100 [Flavobacterium limnosediminis JC2902]|uniref:Lipoprotein n=1 Tax=Flavobacterium limnosediminis JC2902 TaxID=1341181 RepID=V6SR50_9FLAO|nr:hypothetical protein [Flavobacterium limnosediminis]ESU29168.1 hypothetical protein FLJC2902T_12100 [Flavobacterium limnosediminis JC2902]
MKKIIFLFLVATITSCNLVKSSIVGIDTTPEWLMSKDIVKEFDKRKIPDGSRFVLDTASYKKSLRKNYISDIEKLDLSSSNDSLYKSKLKKIVKDDSQPVQVRYFDSDYNQIFKVVNCYIDDPIAMNWNINNCFDVFPPKINIEDLNDDHKKLNFFLDHINTVDGKKVTTETLPKADYYAIVFWNSFFKRPSRKLISTIKEYHNKHKDKSTFILYVNNQNAEIWSEIDSAQKREILSPL